MKALIRFSVYFLLCLFAAVVMAIVAHLAVADEFMCGSFSAIVGRATWDILILK